MDRNPSPWDDLRFQHQVLDSIAEAIARPTGRLDSLLRDLVVRLRLSLQVDTAAILLRENGVLVARAAAGLEEEVDRGVRIPVGQGFAGRIAATGQPLVVEDIDRFDVVNPVLQEKRLKSMLGVPLFAGSAVRGVLHVGVRKFRKFESHDIHLLQRVADRLAPAIEKARDQERPGGASTSSP